jgi:hypothetical protein
MPLREKRRVLAQWRRFLQTLARHFNNSERCYRAFGQALYEHLIQHCSFVAQYNRSDFFSHYFEHGDDTVQFLRQFDRQADPDGRSTEYESTFWLDGQYADINEAMREAAAEYLHGTMAVATDDQKRLDLAWARYLADRHGHAVTAT